jgi:hypothetical protein
MIISVTSDRRLAFPQEVQELLQPGDDYDLLMTVDGMLLKKVNRVDAVDRLNEDESAQLYAEIYVPMFLATCIELTEDLRETYCGDRIHRWF